MTDFIIKKDIFLGIQDIITEYDSSRFLANSLANRKINNIYWFFSPSHH